ncbi:MAG: MBL fold metallo-hydrolase [Syntrophobacterales bacterium]|jgi:hydroxyacylglutathione hydrolase
MTDIDKDKDLKESIEDPQSIFEEQESVLEPLHPGWQNLGQVLKPNDPFFEKIYFMLAYEYSSNIYVIKGDQGLSIVDPGNDYTSFLELFQQGWCQPQDIKKIALTHGHRDHCSGALELLRGYPSFIDSGGFELFLHKESPAELKEMVKKFDCRVTELEGGETIELGGLPWEVIYTPGHTIDGLSFYHAPTKTAFTGDVVMPHSMGEVDEKAGGRLDHYLFGVKTLLKKDIENVLPGHGFPVAEHGKRVIELTYESLMLKILGVEDKIPWISGAEALARQGLLEEAVFCCDKALATNPDNLRALQVKALCLADLARGEEAIEVLDVILDRESQDPFALTAKGNALLGLGKYEESLEYFNRALEVAPQIQEAQVYKGMALYLLGRYDEAMDIDVFSREFASHLKTELEKLAQEKGS